MRNGNSIRGKSFVGNNYWHGSWKNFTANGFITNVAYSEISHNVTCNIGYNGQCNCSCGTYSTYDKDGDEHEIDDPKLTNEFIYRHNLTSDAYFPKTKKMCVVIRMRPRARSNA